MADDGKITSRWTVQMRPDDQGEDAVKTLFFDLQIDDRGVVTGDVFDTVEEGAPSLAKVTGRRQPGLNDQDGSLITLSFNSGDSRVLMSGFTFFDGTFTRIEARYRLTEAGEAAPLGGGGVAVLASGPGDTGTGTGSQT